MEEYGFFYRIWQLVEDLVGTHPDEYVNELLYDFKNLVALIIIMLFMVFLFKFVLWCAMLPYRWWN
ncbi:MAG: hypothetical protein ACOCP4_03840 [Candidatus Woesearchaeota archaeon]|uniref:Uncharacterized protein n=1 Tax=Arfiviricetes sp. TaxID=2832556 RepID=A0AB39A3C1_9VIRU